MQKVTAKCCEGASTSVAASKECAAVVSPPPPSALPSPPSASPSPPPCALKATNCASATPGQPKQECEAEADVQCCINERCYGAGGNAANLCMQMAKMECCAAATPATQLLGVCAPPSPPPAAEGCPCDSVMIEVKGKLTEYKKTDYLFKHGVVNRALYSTDGAYSTTIDANGPPKYLFYSNQEREWMVGQDWLAGLYGMYAGDLINVNKLYMISSGREMAKCPTQVTGKWSLAASGVGAVAPVCKPEPTKCEDCGSNDLVCQATCTRVCCDTIDVSVASPRRYYKTKEVSESGRPIYSIDGGLGSEMGDYIFFSEGTQQWSVGTNWEGGIKTDATLDSYKPTYTAPTAAKSAFCPSDIVYAWEKHSWWGFLGRRLETVTNTPDTLTILSEPAIKCHIASTSIFTNPCMCKKVRVRDGILTTVYTRNDPADRDGRHLYSVGGNLEFKPATPGGAPTVLFYSPAVGEWATGSDFISATFQDKQPTEFKPYLISSGREEAMCPTEVGSEWTYFTKPGGARMSISTPTETATIQMVEGVQSTLQSPIKVDCLDLVSPSPPAASPPPLPSVPDACALFAGRTDARAANKWCYHFHKKQLECDVHFVTFGTRFGGNKAALCGYDAASRKCKQLSRIECTQAAATGALDAVKVSSPPPALPESPSTPPLPEGVRLVKKKGKRLKFKLTLRGDVSTFDKDAYKRTMRRYLNCYPVRQRQQSNA